MFSWLRRRKTPAHEARFCPDCEAGVPVDAAVCPRCRDVAIAKEVRTGRRDAEPAAPPLGRDTLKSPRTRTRPGNKPLCQIPTELR